MLSLVKSSLLLSFAEQPLASAFALGKMRPGSPGDDCTMPFLLRNKQPAACGRYSSMVLSAVKSAAGRWVTVWIIPELGRCCDDPQASDTKSQIFSVQILYLSQVQDSSFVLTLLCSNNCCLIKVAWSSSETVLIFRTLCIGLPTNTIVWVHHMIINSPDFFIQALKLQPITLFHTATRSSEHSVSLLLRAASRESSEAISTICMVYIRIPTHKQNSTHKQNYLHTLILINRLSLGQSVKSIK